jgi:DeoR/GlpR family transcriptional regulator of sugar metabolism
MAQRLHSQVRKARIREMLMKQELVSITDLAVMLKVSEMTIRRDLDELERGGEVRRTHGGAVASERMSFEFNFHQRRQTRQLQKMAIAAEAAKLIQPGQRLIIDNGTTTLELALALKDIENLTVITPSLAVASALQYSETIQTFLLGGLLRRGRPDLTGGLTEHTLDMFAADIAFQGADGIDREGWQYIEDVQLACVDQKICLRAQRTYILADSQKIGKTALIRSGHLKERAGLITDDEI